MPFKIWFLALLSVGLSALAQVSMKIGMNAVRKLQEAGPQNLSLQIWQVISSPFVFLGLCLYAIATVVWLIVLSRAQLSMVYPLVSLAFVAVAFMSWFFLLEPIPLTRALGISIIVVGVLLVGRG